MLRLRLPAVALATTPLLPWYSSQARIDSDTHIGNPLPLVDWLVAGLAVAAVIQVRLAMVAAVSALVSVGVTLLLMYGDAAEGVSVTFGYGIPIAVVLAALLLRSGARGAQAPEDRNVGRSRLSGGGSRR
jgi:hypothetical protein